MERHDSFGGRQYVKRQEELREKEKMARANSVHDWRSGLRGNARDEKGRNSRGETRKETFLRYSTPPARVSCGERRAFGDPPAITKEKTPRTDRESLLQRLSNPRRIDADRQRDARDMSDKRESPQRKREHGFRNVIAQRDSVLLVTPREGEKVSEPRKRSKNDELTYNKEREIDAARREDALHRREASVSNLKHKEHHWCPAPVSIRMTEQPAEQSYVSHNKTRNVRARVHDWEKEQREKMEAKRRQQEEEEAEEQQRIIAKDELRGRQARRDRIRERSLSRSHSTPASTPGYGHQRRGSRASFNGDGEGSQDAEIRRLQAENMSLRGYVVELKEKERTLEGGGGGSRYQPQPPLPPPPPAHQHHQQQRRTSTSGEKRVPPPAAAPASPGKQHPLHLLEATWVPRRQVEEWRGSLSSNAFQNKVANVSIRYLNAEKAYATGVVTAVTDDSLVVDNGRQLEAVRFYNISNSCFKGSEVSADLLSSVKEVAGSSSPENGGGSNMFAHTHTMQF